jgi:biotin carboxyl carrier protein
MENEIRAPGRGIVHHVAVQPGQTVTLGEVMVEIQ